MDRYQYASNNPIRYNDPTGHVVCEVGEPCGTGASYVKETSYEQMAKNLNKSAQKRYGVTLSDDGEKDWDAANALQVYSGLYQIDNLLDGSLKSLIGSATFELSEHHPDAEHPNSTYHGLTNGTHVTFFTTGSQVIEKMNLFHEFGHVLNSLPGRDNVFSVRLERLNGTANPSFIGADNYVNRDALINGAQKFVQASSNAVTEQWADVFANYIAGNINLNSPEGQDMYSFITNTLTMDVSGNIR